MSRRRRSLLSRLLTLPMHAWQVVWSWILWPFYGIFDFFQSGARSYRSTLARRSWRQLLLDYLLFVPRLLGVAWEWCWQAIVTWPRVMRLRDLASGLPAMLAAIAAVAILFFFSEDNAKLIGAYERGSNLAYEKASQEKDPEQRTEDLKLAQFYSRALVKLKPDDDNYRFNVGYIYQELGEYERAQAIMDDLAPRENMGLAKAHLWQADQFLSPDRPLTSDTLDAAEAHLMRALPTYEPKEEIYRRLGELFYYRYRHYNSRSLDPRQPAKELYLAKADYYLSKLADADTKLALTLADIRQLQGKDQQAKLEVEAVTTKLATHLAGFPDDVESRIMLARAYRMLHRFSDAANVLREGQNLRPNPVFDQELSTVFYYQAIETRQLRPAAYAEQFAALQAAYLAYPTNNFVAYRFVEALTNGKPEEVDIARSALQHLVDNHAPGQLAPFLLGFDCLRRTLPAKAESYFASVRKMQPDATAEVIAGMCLAVFTDQLKNLNPSVARTLFDTALRVWPGNPDLLTVRARQSSMQNNFSSALGDLQTALESRPNNVRLHEMIAGTYEKLGQTDQARKHREEAAKLRSHLARTPR